MFRLSPPSPGSHKVLQGPPPRFISILFAFRVLRCGFGMAAVQHLWYVYYRVSPSFFLIYQPANGPQDQIIILSPIIIRPEPKAAHQFPSHYKEMADIIVGKKQVHI